MRLSSITRFIDKKTEKAFYKLEKGDATEKELFKIINQAMDNIEENAFCGIQVPKKQMPKEYVKKYGITNLWKYDLPKGWRLLYFIRGEDVIVIALILEWLDHKSYARTFKY